MLLTPTNEIPIIEHRIHEKDNASYSASGSLLLDLSGVLNGITIGQAQYYFKCPLRGRFEISDSSFRVDYFSPHIVGFNYYPSKAKEDWELAFHRLFQELIGLRPFERNLEQANLWHLMEMYVDIEVYLHSTPLVITQIGKISNVSRTPHKCPTEITWLDGLQENVPLLSVVPDNFIAFHLGEYFEAIVKRDRMTGEILQIIDCKRLTKWEQSGQRSEEIKALENVLFGRTAT